jgi:hypothetical protein
VVSFARKKELTHDARSKTDPKVLAPTSLERSAHERGRALLTAMVIGERGICG